MTGAKAGLPGFDERFVRMKGVRLRYFVAGSGRPLVLIHGLGGAASNWIELASRLAESRRVLVPELPGHGGSSPLPAAPNLNPYADAVASIGEREGLLPAPFVGHSFGGVVAIRMALRLPRAVTGLVLAATAGISSATGRARYALELTAVLKPGRRIAPLRRLIARVPVLRYPVFGGWGAADPPALSPAATEGFLAGPPLHTDTLSAARALVFDDPRAELERIRCPALVVWGSADNQLPLGDAFDFARRLRAQVRVIPGCGHLLIGERPDACLDAIAALLDRIGEVDELPVE
jgi:pimeloyl-ACP methyl ester carboxylesterase